MSERKLSYLNRTYDDYYKALLEKVKTNYPEMADKFNDASIGSWLIETAASIADNLSFHIDRVYGETNLDSASERSSVLALARSNGLKVPGPKGSIAEEKFSCYLPVTSKINNDGSTVPMPNLAYSPIIKRGTKLSSGSQYFEVMDDIDFAEQFNNDGVSDKQVTPIKDNTGKITKYLIEKIGIVSAGETKIYRQQISNSDIKPFMEIVLPDLDIMSIESIIFKDGSNYSETPTMAEFMNPNEFVPASSSPTGVDTYRFFEVESLSEQYRWGDDTKERVGKQDIGNAVRYEYSYYNQDDGTIKPCYSVCKGAWLPLTQKFVTEYTDNGYMKITFGSGEPVGQQIDYSNATDFSKYQITKMVRNNFMGRLPKGGMTMFIQYRVGGGASSNVPAGKINQISYLNAEIGRCVTNDSDARVMAQVRDSIKCTNLTPSVTGKDAPSVDEIKNMIKYNAAAQNRCITLKDYASRVLMMPARYGSPFRVGVIEENNKVMMYLLGIDGNGRLSSEIPEQLVKNIENYLSYYRTLNDFIEIKSGRIINLSFEIDAHIDKNYNAGDVIKNIIDVVTKYMDINKHELGEDIFVGDLEKEIGKVDGVINMFDLRIYNEYGIGYSSSITEQETVTEDFDSQSSRSEIDLEVNDYVLKTDSDEMFEIKYPENDIRVRVKLV